MRQDVEVVSADGSAGIQPSNLYAALARTLPRALTLWFSRPPRLFRPTKISGWSMLRALAQRDGSQLSPQYMSLLIKQHGVSVIPKHFVPPLIVNIFLGTVLWATYAETSSRLGNQLKNTTLTAALSGAVAGGAQAIVAAPIENVRLLLESGGTIHGSWSHAWKEVFRGTEALSGLPAHQRLKTRDAKQIKLWMDDVRVMAGRGWNGTGWGFFKDMSGFAIFFAVFDISRRCAKFTSSETDRYFKKSKDFPFSRFVHAVVLVSGGIAAGICYEHVCRPFDLLRRLTRTVDTPSRSLASRSRLILCTAHHQIVHGGVSSLFQNPEAYRSSPSRPVLRALTRLGPYGLAFLAWETFGPQA